MKMKDTNIGLVLGFSLAIGVSAIAGSVGTLTTFSSGTTISSSEVNANFQAIKTAVDDNHNLISSVDTSLNSNITSLNNSINSLSTNLQALTVMPSPIIPLVANASTSSVATKTFKITKFDSGDTVNGSPIKGITDFGTLVVSFSRDTATASPDTITTQTLEYKDTAGGLINKEVKRYLVTSDGEMFVFEKEEYDVATSTSTPVRTKSFKLDSNSRGILLYPSNVYPGMTIADMGPVIKNNSQFVGIKTNFRTITSLSDEYTQNGYSYSNCMRSVENQNGAGIIRLHCPNIGKVDEIDGSSGFRFELQSNT